MQEVLDLTEQPFMLDGNSVGGLLYEIFGTEVTAAPARCAHCGRRSEVGAMLAFGREMGTVLFCPNCHGVMMRIVEIAGEYRIDMQGIAYFCLERPRP